MRVSLDLGCTAGCCGVTQLYGFSDEETGRSFFPIQGEGGTPAAAYLDLFQNLRKYDFEEEEYGRVLQIWFQKNSRFDGTFDDVCQAEEFRLLIETIPGCVFLGEFDNPNSGNKIMGYQWLAN